MNEQQSNEENTNPDPITHEDGSHPIGTGVGAAGGGWRAQRLVDRPALPSARSSAEWLEHTAVKASPKPSTARTKRTTNPSITTAGLCRSGTGI
ncbi:MAG TPA: hypothetical protein VK993_11065 [Chthoniobacterales bacterium]|nr:hypothetical protein [Chthoniobacterales bacterium]